MSYFLAKLKHCIESDWVSATTSRRPLKHPVFLKEPKRTVLLVGGLAKQKTQARPAFQKPPSSHHRQQLNKWLPDEYLLI